MKLLEHTVLHRDRWGNHKTSMIISLKACSNIQALSKIRIHKRPSYYMATGTGPVISKPTSPAPKHTEIILLLAGWMLSPDNELL
jgi:hypothetical protein